MAQSERQYELNTIPLDSSNDSDLKNEEKEIIDSEEENNDDVANVHKEDHNGDNSDKRSNQMEDINVDNVDNVDNGAMENKEEAPQVMETCNGGESLDLAQPQDANIR